MNFKKMDFDASHFKVSELIEDYKLAYMSRQTALLGRKEVLNGKAKFGIFGDGKELPQIVLAKVAQAGDWRSGYYRDQTLMFALGLSNVKEFFAQLYADTDINHEPHSGGRQMDCHYGTRFLEEDGTWKNQLKTFNVASDISPTAGQMARLLGLAYASKLYRENSQGLSNFAKKKFSLNGNEIAFGTIGNASTSEGVFWEVINAAGVLQVPMLVSVWDDDYGISVPSLLQTTKESISEILSGFHEESTVKQGLLIYKVKGYDYQELYRVYSEAVYHCRKFHKPCVVHVTHLTQPQGHSTSGSHERYKNKERLDYEKEIDGLKRMRDWLLSEKKVSLEEIKNIENEIDSFVENEKKIAWNRYRKPIEQEKKEVISILDELALKHEDYDFSALSNKLNNTVNCLRKDLQTVLQKAVFLSVDIDRFEKESLLNYFREYKKKNKNRYTSKLHSQTFDALSQQSIPAEYLDSKTKEDGRKIIQKFFDLKLEKIPELFILGEDVGQLGGVNLEFEGLQKKYGKSRVIDTGIREATIFGQGMGASMRGLRPIVDIQYLDYLVYCLQGLTDDLATLHYRTAGGQIAPTIIRTKGHRLEGIWHTGSPMGMLLGSLRGLFICVPRNSVQAAGMYQSLFKYHIPALVIEVLNAYRVKEEVPTNLDTFSLPLGLCEVLKKGKDITVVSYGACLQIAMKAAKDLLTHEIDIEIIDIQTLLPFDIYKMILKSIMKTNAVIFLDEDVEGGASAFMMQEVLEKQGAYDYLDSKPRTLCAEQNRSAYASDGDYYCKPNSDDLFRLAYEIMHEKDPIKYPDVF